MLKNAKAFIQETESMSKKKKNLSLFKDFFESLPADYAEMLINTENSEKNKEFVAEIKNRISDLKDRIKKN